MLKELPKKVPEMEVLDHDALCLIADLAAGLTKEEIMTGMDINKDDLSEEEVVFFDQFYNFGKMQTMHKVLNNLVESTKGRQGQQAAMQYLRRFAKNFEGEVEGDSSGTFSFRFGG